MQYLLEEEGHMQVRKRATAGQMHRALNSEGSHKLLRPKSNWCHWHKPKDSPQSLLLCLWEHQTKDLRGQNILSWVFAHNKETQSCQQAPWGQELLECLKAHPHYCTLPALVGCKWMATNGRELQCNFALHCATRNGPCTIFAAFWHIRSPLIKVISFMLYTWIAQQFKKFVHFLTQD